ncbi:MAG: hypothetical protein ACRD88_07015, partial [Terriglobia bacterium]
LLAHTRLTFGYINFGVANTLIEVRGAEGNLVKPKSGLEADRVWGRRKSTSEFVHFIEGTHAWFFPGDFFGSVVLLQHRGFELGPGTYRLRATYRQERYDDLLSDKQFEDAKKKLRYPWWGNVESNWVEIEIQP